MMKKIAVLILFVVILFLSFIPIINGRDQQELLQERFGDLTVVLDAGHGGKDGGASSASGIIEKDIALIVTQKVADHLRLQGINVIMTRDGDYDLASPGATKRKREDLNARARLFNEQTNGIAVSIHCNATTDSRWKGAQTFYHPGRLENQLLANSIMTGLNNHLDGSTRESKQINNILILKHSKIPTALVEIGFLSNPEEASRLNTEAHQQQIAYAIFEGILAYLDNPEAQN
jgi:N-acetylmuramoyl-L-alanine amidase